MPTLHIAMRVMLTSVITTATVTVHRMMIHTDGGCATIGSVVMQVHYIAVATGNLPRDLLIVVTTAGMWIRQKYLLKATLVVMPMSAMG